MALTEEEARERIARMTAAAYEPVLDEGELDDLIALAKRPDVDDRDPEDDGWVPTWDLNFAAAEGWGYKAAKVAGDFDYTDDAGNYRRQQVFEMCAAREKHYRSRAIGSLPISRNTPTEELPIP